MTLHLRQVALVAEKLQPVLDDLRTVLGLEVCYVDPEVEIFGLENALLPVGTNFLEVVAPIKAGTAAGRYLERRGGDGGYMVITQADGRHDQDAHRVRAEQLGIRIVWQHDHDRGRFMQLHPGDTGGAFFEIDSTTTNDPLGEWPPAGSGDWQQYAGKGLVRSIRAVEIQTMDPQAIANRWAAVAAAKFEEDAQQQIVLPLNNAAIRFVKESDGRGEGLSAIDIQVDDKAGLLANAANRGIPMTDNQVTICGVRFNFA